MNNLLEIDLIIGRKDYSKIYNGSTIIAIIILTSIYILNIFSYQTYYIQKGKMVSNQLELIVNINDIKYFKDNDLIEIDNQSYSYRLARISNEIYTDDEYNNYVYMYLDIDNLTNIDNYVYEIKIPKENKILAKYLKNYL